MAKESVRIQKWDNVKFFLIFLVVLGHIADIYANISPWTGILRFYIYTFHMPLFLYISGLFSKNNVDRKRWNKIFSYLILYLFIKIIDFFAKWPANGTQPRFDLFSEASVPWYAFCLFAFCLISIPLSRVRPAYVFTVSIILACVSGYARNLGDFLCLSRIIVYFPFFYAGYLTDREKLEKLLKNKIVIASSVLLLITAGIIITVFYTDIKNIKFLFTGRNPYSVFVKNCPYAFVYRLICYVVSSLIGFAFMAVIPSGRISRFVSAAGKASVQIYSLHFALKILYFGLLNNRFHIDSYFTSKLILYELLVAAALTVICALPFWKKPINAILNIPIKKGEPE